MYSDNYDHSGIEQLASDNSVDHDNTYKVRKNSLPELKTQASNSNETALGAANPTDSGRNRNRSRSPKDSPTRRNSDRVTTNLPRTEDTHIADKPTELNADGFITVTKKKRTRKLANDNAPTGFQQRTQVHCIIKVPLSTADDTDDNDLDSISLAEEAEVVRFLTNQHIAKFKVLPTQTGEHRLLI